MALEIWFLKHVFEFLVVWYNGIFDEVKRKEKSKVKNRCWWEDELEIDAAKNPTKSVGSIAVQKLLKSCYCKSVGQRK